MNARRLFAIVSVVALTLAGAGVVHALDPEEASRHLELLKTQIKTTVGIVAAGTTVELFTPTTVTCPPRSCTLRVEISVGFRGTDPLTYGVARVQGRRLDQRHPSRVTTRPSPTAECTNSFSSQTFTFMKEGLGKGDHTVTVDFYGGQRPRQPGRGHAHRPDLHALTRPRC